MPIRVAYTGEPGAFAEEAVLRFVAAPVAVPVSSFRAAFEAVRDRVVVAAVVPVESSLLGTIRENLDLLWEFELPIVGEVSVPVRLALLAQPGETLESITRVYSISAALAQADEFLRSRPWTVQTSYNTAGAAKQVAEAGERGAAAVASARVASIYGLEILADDIQSGSDNRTRFAVIALPGSEARAAVLAAARPDALAGPPRTSLAFAVRNVPGSLYRSLGAFATQGLNLSRLESRPWTARTAALGVPVLGRPRRRSRGPRLRPGARGAARRDGAGPDPGHVPEGDRGLINGGRRLCSTVCVAAILVLAGVESAAATPGG